MAITEKHFVSAGETVRIEIPYSEVCMHMQVAGRVMNVRFEHKVGHTACAQLLQDGREFSAPITPGEAGFYWEDGRYYCYPVNGDPSSRGRF
jgi:hypothetical protein